MFMGISGSDIEKEMVTNDDKCPKLRGHAFSCSFHVYVKARQDDGRNGQE